MKKIMSTIVAALAAISFAAPVSAADVSTPDHAGNAQSAEMPKSEATPMKKHHKHHKHHVAAKKKQLLRHL